MSKSADRAHDGELGRAVHGPVDRRVGLHRVEAAHDLLGPRLQPAHVAPVELHHRRLELRRGGLAAALAGADRVAHVRLHRVEQLVAAGDEGGDRGRRVGRDHAQQPGRALERVQQREHAAPRLSDDVVAPVDAQVRGQGRQLALEALRRSRTTDRRPAGGPNGRCRAGRRGRRLGRSGAAARRSARRSRAWRPGRRDR